MSEQSSEQHVQNDVRKPDDDERRLAAEAVKYLREHSLVVEASFDQENPPSEELADFLDEYLEDAVWDNNLDDGIIENLEMYYDLE